MEVVLVKGIFTAIASVFCLTISLWVLLSGKKQSINRILFILISFSLITVLLDYLATFLSEPFITVFMRLAYCAGVLSLGSFLVFSWYFPYKQKVKPIVIVTAAVSSLIFTVVTIFTNLVVFSAELVKWGVMVEEGALIGMYYVFLIVFLTLGYINILKKYKNSSHVNRAKTRLILVGMSIFAIGQIVFTIVLPTIGVRQYYFIGDYSIIIFSALSAYAIVKNHLFDVRLAIVRSVTYTLVLMTLAVMYFIFAFVFSSIFDKQLTTPGQIFSGVVISLVMAIAFQPLKRFFDRITNRIFYKDNYNTDDFFAKLNQTLSVNTDLRSLLERTAYIIRSTLKSEQAFFFINTATGHHVSAGTERHNQIPKRDIDQIDSEDVIVASLLPVNNSVRRMMVSHKIELILPLVHEGNQIGYLCLGYHLTSSYTNRDIRVLNTISDELIIAIKNALAVQEIRELNATLQQKVANATKELRSSNAILRQLDKVKDEFISMASHQLRTPLTSVKGYLSMVMEGDAGKITAQQNQLLNEAFMSSERMVHLINDFLNVSRIQTGKFIIDKTTVDLSKLVGEEIDSLRPNATARGMKFIYKAPNDFPTVEVDEGKMRQVVMNFADNAIYYSRENGTIEIDLSVESNDIVFKVKDSGIGVPKREREHLFSKFYRASNARVQRPDGTGVGIYLAKKVIDAHHGQIIFDSVEGQGSTFGFRLPLK